MNTYKIELRIKNTEHGIIESAQNWSAYTEQQAIAQCFLYNAQQGATAIEVLSIELK